MQALLRYSHRTAILSMPIILASFVVSPIEGATWTDLRGQATIEAELVGVWGETAILRKPDGTRLSVPLTGLRAESRIQAEQLNKALVEHRNTRISEFKSNAAEADAAAPNPLPAPPPSAAYQPPTAEMKPDEFLHHINAQVKAGHLVVYYDALPPSYRKQVDELYAAAVAKIDANNFVSFAQSLQQFGELVVTHQNWIFSHPRLAAMPENAGQQLRDVVLATAEVVRQGFNSELVSLDKLRSTPLRDYLVLQDKAISPFLAQIAGSSDEIVQILVDSNKDNVATVTFTQGAVAQKTSLTSVEGFWVPTAMAKSWDADMKSASETLAAKGNGEILSGGVTTVIAHSLQPLLAPLQEAKDATQFHIAMETMFRNAQPLVSSLASVDMGGFRLGGGSAPNGYENSDGSSGYDMDMEREMQMRMQQEAEASGRSSGGSSSSGPPRNAMEAARATAERAKAGTSPQP